MSASEEQPPPLLNDNDSSTGAPPRMGTRRRLGMVALSMGVSAFFLWLVLRNVPLAEVIASIRQADIRWLLVSFGAVLLALWTRGIRWRGLLDNRISSREAFYIMGITFTLNQLPLRAGEIARSYLASQREIPFVTAATSILIERLLDTLLVVLVIAVTLTRLPDAPAQVSRGAWLFGIAALVGVGLLVLMARYPDAAHALLRWSIRRLPLLDALPLPDWLDNLLQGLHPLTDPRKLAHALVWTLISWSVSLVSLLSLEVALGIDNTTVPLLWSALLGMTLASLSIAIPVSIAGLGLFEAAITLTGQIVGMDEISYTALGFLYHGMSIFGYVTVGLIAAWTLRLSPRQMMSSSRDET